MVLDTEHVMTDRDSRLVRHLAGQAVDRIELFEELGEIPEKNLREGMWAAAGDAANGTYVPHPSERYLFEHHKSVSGGEFEYGELEEDVFSSYLSALIRHVVAKELVESGELDVDTFALDGIESALGTLAAGLQVGQYLNHPEKAE